MSNDSRRPTHSARRGGRNDRRPDQRGRRGGQRDGGNRGARDMEDRLEEDADSAEEAFDAREDSIEPDRADPGDQGDAANDESAGDATREIASEGAVGRRRRRTTFTRFARASSPAG